MSYPLLVPIRSAETEKKPAGGEDFWKTFWKDFSNAEAYTTRISSIGTELDRTTSVDLPPERRLYAEITLDEQARVKTKRPERIWDKSNLDIVEFQNENTLTVSGTKQDFEKFKRLLQQSNFETAKSGSRNSDRNIAREFYAVSGFRSKNTGAFNRIDKRLQSLLSSDEVPDTIHCIIEVHPSEPRRYYDHYYSLLNQKIENEKVTKRDQELFVHNMSYNANLEPGDINEILEDPTFSFVQKIKIYPTYSAQRCIPREDFQGVTVDNPITSEIVGVFDSGIDHTVFNGLSFNRENFVNGKPEDKNHGTFVASRILFGPDIYDQLDRSRTLVPVAKFLDVQVLFQDANGDPTADLDTLQKAIKQVIERYSDIAVYNFSISKREPVQEDLIDELTEFIDEICRINDIIFVCSVGNHDSFLDYDYDEIFSEGNTAIRVASPGDALNVITVGSLAHKVEGDCICTEENYPSPFTRAGGIRGDCKKPELVIEGGNIQRDPSSRYDQSFLNASNNVVGVEGINTRGLNKDYGTSHSTPLVTGQILQLLDYIKLSNISDLLTTEGNRANLIKALMIHSTQKVTQASITNDALKRAYGFGIPDYKKVVEDDPNTISVIYCDKVNSNNKKHRLHIELPEELMNRKLEFGFTLTYNPPVDKNFPQQYNMIWLQASLRTVTPIVDSDTGEILKYNADSISPSPEWDNYKNERYNVISYNFNKRKLRSPLLEILVQMNLFPQFEKLNSGREEGVDQPYALILTIRDRENTEDLRDKFIATNQFNVLVENVVQVHT